MHTCYSITNTILFHWWKQDMIIRCLCRCICIWWLDDHLTNDIFQCFRRSNEILKSETFMFDKYMKRIDTKDLGPSQSTTQGFQQGASSGQEPPVGRNNRYVYGVVWHTGVVTSLFYVFRLLCHLVMHYDDKKLFFAIESDQNRGLHKQTRLKDWERNRNVI